MPADRNSTRERLLKASLQTFGHNDYQAVSTRSIVTLANANISAISYHFGGKEQLYLATAEYLAKSLGNNMHPVMQDIWQQLDSGADFDCRQLLTNLIHALVHDVLEGELSAHAAGFIFREQLHPSPAYDILYRELMEPMQSTFCRLLACALNRDPEEKAMKLMAHALLGQVLIYRIGQTTILRRLNSDGFDREDVTQIAQIITQNILAAVDAPLQQDS